ncbi:hypothetical protein V5799_014940 [Amblyomma americanum]|uniref:Uncharacterized protein n=1 Tax=Amblyomma americanum TaxID=6943 RepID=A0AAQ4E1K4_AMBAM
MQGLPPCNRLHGTSQSQWSSADAQAWLPRCYKRLLGLLGHTQNLVQVQQRSVGFVIHTLPIIANFLPCWPPRAPPSH